jgi:hypothetical protein
VSPKDKPLVWLKTEIKSPPFSDEARIEAGYLLRLLQQGHNLNHNNYQRGYTIPVKGRPPLFQKKR